MSVKNWLKLRPRASLAGWSKPALFVALAVLAATQQPAAASDAAVRRGEAVIEAWCRDCHPRPDQDASAFDAPPYEVIVRLPDHDEAYFRRFLDEDHFPMPTFRLFDTEKADVVVYLMALQASTPRP